MKHILVLLLAIGCSGQGSQDDEVTPEVKAAIAREKKRIEEEKTAIEKYKRQADNQGKKSLDPSLIKRIEDQRKIIRREFSLGCDAAESVRFKKTHTWYVGIEGSMWHHVPTVFRNEHENIIRALNRWGRGTVYPVKARDFAQYMGACR